MIFFFIHFALPLAGHTHPSLFFNTLSFSAFFLPASLRLSPGGKSGYLHSLSQQWEKQVAAVSLAQSSARLAF